MRNREELALAVGMAIVLAAAPVEASAKEEVEDCAPQVEVDEEAAIRECQQESIRRWRERNPAPKPLAPPPAIAPPAPIRWGVTRTPEEEARCREEERARIDGRPYEILVLPGKSVRLRAKGAVLDREAITTAARRLNLMYSEGGREAGCFVNAFWDLTSVTVVDYATGLMWEVWASDKLPFSAVKERIAKANGQDWYSDWRLPTVEELLSLSEPLEIERIADEPFELARTGLGLSSPGGYEFWSADSTLDKERGISMRLAVRGSSVNQWEEQHEHSVRLVRTARLPPVEASARTSVQKEAAVTSLPWGVTRTWEEEQRCRQEEAGRIQRRFVVPVVPGRTVRLRARAAVIGYEKIAAAAGRLNFHRFISGGSQPGCFVNAFTDRADDTVVDRATGLMWQRHPSASLELQAAKEYVAGLNREKFAGYSNWRLPTVEELQSLAETTGELRLDPWFFTLARSGWLYWSADSDADPLEWWVVGGNDVHFTGLEDADFPVRAVRTVKP